jgi:hypothetical protein
MEWINGPTLAQAVERATNAGNGQVLRALSAAFVQCWNDLQVDGFSHGDLNAHNVLVRPNGQIAWVDLDTATWRGAPLGSAGHGTAGYRHPTLHRDAQLRDAYAALVIVASLHAVADTPTLRRDHGDAAADIDGTMLFSAWDLADPSASPVFGEAFEAAANDTRDLLDALVQASLGGADDIRDACRVIPNLKLPETPGESGVVAPGTWDIGPVVARMRAHYSDSWNVTEDQDLQGERVPDNWGEPQPGAGWPTVDVAPEVAETLSLHVTTVDIDELEAAIASNDEADVVRIWSQVRDEPLAQLLAAEVAPVLSASYERRVMAEARRRKDAAVLALADEAENRGATLGKEARIAVRAAREREAVRAKLETALAAADARGLAELAVSGELVVLGDADRSSLQRVLQAIEWPGLQRAIQADDDGLILAAFDEELFEGSTLLNQESRDRIDLANSRVRWLSAMREALRRRNSQAFRDLLVDPPEGAVDRLSPSERRRVRRAIERSQTLSELREAVESGDDQRVIGALNKVERVGARIPDRKTWARIQEVVERESLIDEIVEVSRARPLDHARVAQLLPAVKALGLEHDPRLGDDRLVERLEHEVIRMAHVRRIRAAISRDNDVAIVTAAVPDPYDALDMLEEPERNRVAAAIRAKRSFARSRA